MLKYKLNIEIILACTLIALSTASGWGADSAFEPWEFDRQDVAIYHPSERAQTSDTNEDYSFSARIALAGLSVFSEYISKVDGDRCPMYPTCASYSRRAFKKHGFFVGMMMTADRLIHETDEMRYSTLVRVGSKMRYSDSLKENDFWWYNDEGLDKK